MAASTTSLKLDDEIKGKVQRLAVAQRRSPHWIMREAIAQYVEREEKREQFRQSAIAAWSDYQTTGLHITATEADAWLAKLEAGEEIEPPEWHGCTRFYVRKARWPRLGRCGRSATA